MLRARARFCGGRRDLHEDENHSRRIGASSTNEVLRSGTLFANTWKATHAPR